MKRNGYKGDNWKALQICYRVYVIFRWHSDLVDRRIVDNRAHFSAIFYDGPLLNIISNYTIRTICRRISVRDVKKIGAIHGYTSVYNHDRKSWDLSSSAMAAIADCMLFLHHLELDFCPC